MSTNAVLPSFVHLAMGVRMLSDRKLALRSRRSASSNRGKHYSFLA